MPGCPFAATMARAPHSFSSHHDSSTEEMPPFNGHNFQDRQAEAANARKAQLEKFRSRPDLLPGLPSTPAAPPAAVGALVEERPLAPSSFCVAVLGWTLLPAAGPVVLPAPPVCWAQAADPMTSAEASAAPVKIVLVRIS